MKDDLAEALNSAKAAMTFSARDWSLNHRDAWLYGIVVGWDDALDEVANNHKWNDETVERLIRYRKAVEAKETE